MASGGGWLFGKWWIASLVGEEKQAILPLQFI
jgi:hypothetical protein